MLFIIACIKPKQLKMKISISKVLNKLVNIVVNRSLTVSILCPSCINPAFIQFNACIKFSPKSQPSHNNCKFLTEWPYQRAKAPLNWLGDESIWSVEIGHWLALPLTIRTDVLFFITGHKLKHSYSNFTNRRTILKLKQLVLLVALNSTL